MVKPKENTIAKIDQLLGELRAAAPAQLDLEPALALANRCHTMNIHKAKVAYFKKIKLLLAQGAQLCASGLEGDELESQWQALNRQMRALLDAKNG
ncbi:MAG: hypothetical protein ABFR97_10800 [Thermodesulfobacteriota bacterium]